MRQITLPWLSGLVSRVGIEPESLSIAQLLRRGSWTPAPNRSRPGPPVEAGGWGSRANPSGCNSPAEAVVEAEEAG
jgi:hypothetical protein